MARLVILIVLVLGVTLFYVKAESLPEESDALLAEEDKEDRNSYASAYGSVGGVNRPGHLGPAPPGAGPHPTQTPPRLVECFACIGCPNAANATTKYCPYSIDPLKNGRCIVYSEKYYHMKTPWVVRGCVSERGNCADIRDTLSHQSDLVKLLSCRDCEGDLCNGAGHSLPDLMSALVFMFMTPLLMKYTLS